MIEIRELKRLMQCFERGYCFINRHLDFVPCNGASEYFRLEDCETTFDVKCKVLEWLSRGACKSEPFRPKKQNEAYHRMMLEGINAYLGTDFTTYAMDVIYTRLGNRCNHALTIKFVESGYDFAVLEERE